MSRSGAVVLAVVLVACSASVAVAGEGDDDEEPHLITGGGSDEPPPVDDLPKDHHHQLGLALQIPVGIRAIIPYDGEYCGSRGENESANAEACLGRQPFTLDFEIAYGLKPNLELLLELRIGLERDFGPTAAMDDDGPRLFHWSPGAKWYFSDAGTSKLFSTAQIAFDHTSYDNEAGTDFALRNVNGLQLDLHPSYGVYFFVAEEMAFRRWLTIGVEFGAGIQGRYP